MFERKATDVRAAGERKDHFTNRNIDGGSVCTEGKREIPKGFGGSKVAVYEDCIGSNNCLGSCYNKGDHTARDIG